MGSDSPSSSSSGKAGFSVGDPVTLVEFRRKGTIVAGPNQKGEYQVQCGALAIWVLAAKLALADASLSIEKPKEAVKKRKKSEKVVATQTRIRLDLHGMNRDEAIRKLESTLDLAMRSEGARGESVCIELIHGLGKGTIRDAVQKYLSQSKVISSFRPDVQNPGVTWVYL